VDHEIKSGIIQIGSRTANVERTEGIFFQKSVATVVEYSSSGGENNVIDGEQGIALPITEFFHEQLKGMVRSTRGCGDEKAHLSQAEKCSQVNRGNPLLRGQQRPIQIDDKQPLVTR
jgi:hypothetical protein